MGTNSGPKKVGEAPCPYCRRMVAVLGGNGYLNGLCWHSGRGRIHCHGSGLAEGFGWKMPERRILAALSGEEKR